MNVLLKILPSLPVTATQSKSPFKGRNATFNPGSKPRKVKEFSRPLRSLAERVSVGDLLEILVEECRDLDGIEPEIGRPDAQHPVETALVPSRVYFQATSR